MRIKTRATTLATIDRKKLGERIRRARHSMSLTLEELGTRVGVAKATACNWESGRCLPPTQTILRIAVALRRSVDFLLTGKPRRMTIWQFCKEVSPSGGGDSTAAGMLRDQE